MWWIVLKGPWNWLEVSGLTLQWLKHLCRVLMATSSLSYLPLHFLFQFTLTTHQHEWFQMPQGNRRRYFCSTPFISTLPDMLFSVLLQLFHFLLYLASTMRVSLLTNFSTLLAKHEDRCEMNCKLPLPNAISCMRIDLFVNHKPTGVSVWEEPVKNNQRLKRQMNGAWNLKIQCENPLDQSFQ